MSNVNNSKSRLLTLVGSSPTRPQARAATPEQP